MTRKWLTPATLLLAIAGAALVTMLFASGLVEQWTQRELLADLKTRIDAASDEDAIQLVHELENLDVAAIPLLVQLLADDREQVADAAQFEIDQLLESWQLLSRNESATRCATLARCLAASADRLQTSRQPAARRIAVRILALPADPEAANAHGLISDCETILRLTTTDASPPQIAIAALPAAPTEESTEQAAVPHYQLSDDATQVEPTTEASPPAFEPPPSPAVEPQRLPDAPMNGEGDPPGRTAEPRRFLAPRAMRIEG